jgi:hypothetical protein
VTELPGLVGLPPFFPASKVVMRSFNHFVSSLPEAPLAWPTCRRDRPVDASASVTSWVEAPRFCRMLLVILGVMPDLPATEADKMAWISC